MNRILIITPQYPPSNLAAVHRSRLFAQHLYSFDWEPIILTVHEEFYEEQLDWNLHALIPSNQQIEKTDAYKITKPRLIGDIGLRAYFQLRRRALELINLKKIDFVYIPIPSFYSALIGPYLYKKTGVKYGIDYIDPWVHEFPGSDKYLSRHWFSTHLAKFLEPIAVKYVSLITGVSEGYFKPVLERNPHLKLQAVTAAMPYGGEEADHEFIRKGASDRGQGTDILHKKSDNSFRFVYAGAMLPKAYKPLEAIFRALSDLNSLQHSVLFKKISFHFIGTLGKIKPIADKYGLWKSIVFEHPERIPYLEVLRNLDIADGIFILGSTEPHYTPSKVYQGVLSQKPILAVLHQESTAVKVLQDSKAGQCVLMDGENDLDTLGDRFIVQLTQYLSWANSFDPKSVNKETFEQYSARSVTKTLVEAIEKCLTQTN
jgi:hypothetical protein